jgi:alpha-L-fucosidase
MRQPKPTQGDTAWFTHARFGLFIHWGLYALPARHEWVQSFEEITPEVYRTYFERFNPDRYDPRQWARVAREAGMRYVVVTTKHHEGFCLWDSQHTDYKITNTPYGQDAIRPLVEAFRAEGLRVGFYYSLLDWHHPHFPIDMYHPLRNHPDAAQINRGRDMSVYADYIQAQISELLTGFHPDILWCDFSYPDRDYQGLPGKGRADWRSEELYALIRELQPDVILNDRLDLPPGHADVHTPEQVQPERWVEVDGEPVVWETCQTFSGSWGYHRDEMTWKSPGQLIRMLVNTVACGGNLLMNVGPTARGTFDQRALDALGVYRDWMALNSGAIYGCTQSTYPAPRDCRLTQPADPADKRLFVHVFAWPFRHLHLYDLGKQVKYAQLLHDGSEIRFTQTDTKITLDLPVREPDVIVPVIELTLD